MAIHDWTRVGAGIFHHFHHGWIAAITGTLNAGLLPPEFYALAEQQAAGFGPDVITHQTARPDEEGEAPAARTPGGTGGLLLVPPRVSYRAEFGQEFFRRKKSTVVVRHVSGDHIVAVVEVTLRATREVVTACDHSSKRPRSCWSTKSTCSSSTCSRRRSATRRGSTPLCGSTSSTSRSLPRRTSR